MCYLAVCRANTVFSPSYVHVCVCVCVCVLPSITNVLPSGLQGEYGVLSLVRACVCVCVCYLAVCRASTVFSPSYVHVCVCVCVCVT